jgi:hypothetical protein
LRNERSKSHERRIARLEDDQAGPREGIAARLDAASALQRADPERAAREVEKSWRSLQADFKAGRLSGLGLRLYNAMKRVREQAAAGSV